MGDIGTLTVNSPTVNIVVCNEPRPTLDWNLATGATLYDIELDTDTDFNTPPAHFRGPYPNNAGPTFQLPVGDELPNGTYYWRILAKNASCNGTWEGPFQFRIDIVPEPTINPIVPNISCDGVPIITWNSIAEAENYNLRIANNAGFTGATSYNNLPQTPTSFTLSSPLSNDNYWVQVQSVSVNSAPGPDCTSVWSTAVTFSVSGITTQPTNLLPLSTDTFFCGTNPLLQWTPTLAPTDGYIVEICTDSNNCSTTLLDSPAPFIPGIANTQYTVVNNLTDGTTYFWRVRPTNTVPNPDCNGPWSNFTHFEADTMEIPTLNPLTAPICTHSPTFTWNAVTGASRYHIQVASDTGFTTDVTSCTIVSPVPPLTSWDSSVVGDCPNRFFCKWNMALACCSRK